MRRIATAAVLAAPLLLGGAGMLAANDGPCTYGLGCWGVPTFRFLPKIHQHGPLFNYGPYYGYPPFEPYGYWNSYLQYTGPVPLPTTGHGGGAGATGWIHSPHPHTFGNGFPHPLHNGGLGHKHKGAGGGCSTCGQVAATYVNSGNALDRYTGVGTPAASAAFYAGSANAVITVGHTDR